jgi:hypothetical protein
MTPRSPFAAALLLFGSLLTACGSRGPLYEKDGTPKDGEIRMTTRWAFGEGSPVDERVVSVKNGVATAVHDGQYGRKEGDVPIDAWERLWRRLDEVAPWSQTGPGVEEDDRSAGPYHLATLTLDGRSRSFSSQLSRGVLSFTTRLGMNRTELTNAIVDFVATYATRETRKGPPPTESRPSEPSKDASDGR